MFYNVFIYLFFYYFFVDAVMPEAPDVFVVHDATLDPRFQSNPLVTGPPFIRFYAGAALLLDDAKVSNLLYLFNTHNLLIVIIICDLLRFI